MREGCDSARLWAESMAPLFCHTTWMAPGRGNTKKTQKARAFANHTRFHLVFLRELRFFVPGTGEHILGEALMESHDARNARRIFPQMVCSNTKQRAKKV